jgi:uncharacterized protein (DUF2252 family)
VRNAVDRILDWHRSITSPDLMVKCAKMAESPFGFFRGTYFLYVEDILRGPWKKFRTLDAQGATVGDVHTENFGAFRAVTGEIVYDINDFDEASTSLYEFDIRRLAVSLVLAALEDGHRLGDGLNAAEAAAREWIGALHRWSGLRRRQFETLPETAQVRKLLILAREQSRTQFLAGLAEESIPGHFVFRRGVKNLRAVSEGEKQKVKEALPDYLQTCVAPRNARPRNYQLHDVAARIAGNGSLGRTRYALLLDKGVNKKAAYSTLRLIEWKESFDSSLDAAHPQASKSRAKDVFGLATNFQLFPKRYLGFTRLGKMPIQAREIGANDRRFAHKEFKDVGRFHTAACLFGGMLARCHLLGSMDTGGPRGIPRMLASGEDRFILSLLRFAAGYSDQVYSDHELFVKRRREVERAWKA